MKKVAFMFPGQGSQAVGMGKKLYQEYTEVQELFHRANKLLDKDLSQLMFQGPKDQLTKTENAQPALLLVSVAITHLLKKENILPTMAVGHSLGEYSALVAADVLSFDQALPLVSYRGHLMEQAFPAGQGTMAAVLGLDQKEIEQVITALNTDEIVEIANFNCPGQIVISGTKRGIEQVIEPLEKAGARRVIELQVSGPFHSSLMKEVSKEFAEHVKKETFHHAQFPVYANVHAKPVTSGEEIRELLVRQLYHPVRFEESIRKMITEGVDCFVELGPGKVLAGLLRRIDRRIKTFTIQDPTSLEEFISWYKE